MLAAADTMHDNQRILRSWERIKHWLNQNFPETLENLYPPAFESQIEVAESILELPFPESLRALLLSNNGEDTHWPPGIFPNGQRFLPTEDIVETWYMLQDFDDESWRAYQWLPVSSTDAGTVVILDFDPPGGGVFGQVAEVDFEKRKYYALASSLEDYLEQYAMDLAVNKYVIKGDFIRLNPCVDDEADTPGVDESAQSIVVEKDIISADDNMAVDYDYLDNDDMVFSETPKTNTHKTATRIEPYIGEPEAKPDPKPKPVAKKPAPKFEIESGEHIIVAGKMTSLMGKEEMLFSIVTEKGKEYTFLAKESFTKGFGSIALDQDARVVAKRVYGEVDSHFIEQGLAKNPDFVAFEYAVLHLKAGSVNKTAAPQIENIDQIAHNILDSVQLNFQLNHDFREVKPEECSYLQSKFYNDVTSKLLKLGFHYIADVEDLEHRKNTYNTPAFFRAMSFLDDGIVASFYQSKGKKLWPFNSSRNIIEFETEFSDGHIIISTISPEELGYSLPQLISRYVHPASIPLEGLLYKHRSKIRRYQTKNPDSAVVKIHSRKQFAELRNRRQQLIYSHLRCDGWVTKEYIAKQLNNQEVAEQVYDKIKQFAGS